MSRQGAASEFAWRQIHQPALQGHSSTMWPRIPMRGCCRCSAIATGTPEVLASRQTCSEQEVHGHSKRIQGCSPSGHHTYMCACLTLRKTCVSVLDNVPQHNHCNTRCARAVARVCVATHGAARVPTVHMLCRRRISLRQRPSLRPSKSLSTSSRPQRPRSSSCAGQSALMGACDRGPRQHLPAAQCCASSTLSMAASAHSHLNVV